MTGLALDIRGVTTFIRTGGSDTGGAFAVVEQRHPAGKGAPLHYHRLESETLVVLEGEYGVLVDGDAKCLRVGESVTVPPGVPHAFVNKGDTIGRLLIVAVAAGIEEYFVAMTELDWEAPDANERVRAMEARFGIVPVSESE